MGCIRLVIDCSIDRLSDCSLSWFYGETGKDIIVDIELVNFAQTDRQTCQPINKQSTDWQTDSQTRWTDILAECLIGSVEKISPD